MTLPDGNHINYHLQSLIELAFKTDPQKAEYHLAKFRNEFGYANLNETGLQDLTSHLRSKHST